MSVKQTNLSHSRQWFNTLIQTVAGSRSVALHCAGLVVELSTRYTTPDTMVEIGCTCATME